MKDPRAIQQITGEIKSTAASTRVIIYQILEQSKVEMNKKKEQQMFCK